MLDDTPSADPQPSSPGGSEGGTMPSPQEPHRPTAPDFDYEDRGQRPVTLPHRDFEIKRGER